MKVHSCVPVSRLAETRELFFFGEGSPKRKCLNIFFDNQEQLFWSPLNLFSIHKLFFFLVSGSVFYRLISKLVFGTLFTKNLKLCISPVALDLGCLPSIPFFLNWKAIIKKHPESNIDKVSCTATDKIVISLQLLSRLLTFVVGMQEGNGKRRG